MDTTGCFSRRRVFISQASVVLLGILAGCVDEGSTNDGAGNSPSKENDDSEKSTAEEAPDSETNDSSEAEDLDLQKANVVAVSFTNENETYSFDVTLQHDDDGEDGYANWWQVERQDGSRLGRRELRHAHSQQPFTRSKTIEVPDDLRCVVVRGHDQTHEYGGQAMVINLESGESQVINQGSERQSIAGSMCP